MVKIYNHLFFFPHSRSVIHLSPVLYVYICYPYAVHIHEAYQSKRLGNKKRSYLFF